jgi:four helix bundle protein
MSNAELKRFLIVAAGSISQLHYQLILSKDLNYLSENLFKELMNETIHIRKMIHRYCEKL